MTSGFQQRMREGRERCGLSLIEVATAVGIPSASVIEQCEGGKTKFPLELVPKLAKCLRIPPRDLLCLWFEDYAPDVAELLCTNSAGN